jgi:hypothetical protein
MKTARQGVKRGHATVVCACSLLQGLFHFALLPRAAVRCALGFPPAAPLALDQWPKGRVWRLRDLPSQRSRPGLIKTG